MAIFYVSVWQGIPQQSDLIWEANVLAQNIEEGYRIGKTRFAIEHPDKDLQNYTMVATGDSVEKSISV